MDVLRARNKTIAFFTYIKALLKIMSDLQNESLFVYQTASGTMLNQNSLLFISL